MIASNIKIIDELKSFITHVKKEKLFFSNDKDFTKERKLPFERLVYLLMNMLKKSLSIELNEFFETIQQAEQCCSKAAFLWWQVFCGGRFPNLPLIYLRTVRKGFLTAQELDRTGKAI